MTLVSRLRAAAVLVPTIAFGIVVPAGSAAADPVSTTLALFAVTDMGEASRTASSVAICAEGTVDDGTPIIGRWVFRVVGTTTVWTNERSGITYPKTCHTIPTNGNPAGTAEATLTYIGVGGDVTGYCTALVTWAPGFPIGWLAGACTGTPPTP